jgi:hypothetical protein
VELQAAESSEWLEKEEWPEVCLGEEEWPEVCLEKEELLEVYLEG